MAGSDITVVNALQAVQNITFAPLSDMNFGSMPPLLSAAASSGLPVTFVSNTTAVCTVSGVTIALVTAGTCSITASQAGNTAYAAAPSITRSFTVNPVSTAAFVKADTTTQGTWKGVYGADGEVMYR